MNVNSVDVHSPPGQGFKWGLGFYLCGWGQGLGSRKTGEDLGAGKGEKQNGHIHYLHTQAARRSTSRWLDKFALMTPGARGQLHSWSALGCPGQSCPPDGCRELGCQGHHRLLCWFLWTRTKKTPLLLAGKEREWQNGRKMLDLCYGEAVGPKKEGSETVCSPESPGQAPVWILSGQRHRSGVTLEALGPIPHGRKEGRGKPLWEKSCLHSWLVPMWSKLTFSLSPLLHHLLTRYPLHSPFYCLSSDAHLSWTSLSCLKFTAGAL